MYSSNSPRAEWIVVFATIDPALKHQGHRAFVVGANTPGLNFLKIEKKMGLRAYETATFALDECFVSEENLLGGESYYEKTAGFEGAMSAFNLTRPVIAAMGVGIARYAYDLGVSYLNEIPKHFVTRRRYFEERLVSIRQQIIQARLICLKAASLADKGEPNAAFASMAKLYAPPVSLRTVETAADILGEQNLLEESIVEKLARDVKAIDIVEGTQQIQRRVVSKRLIGVLNYQES